VKNSYYVDLRPNYGTEISRHNYDINVYILDDNAVNVECEMLAGARRNGLVCRFAHIESLQDTLTMFRINLQLKQKDLDRSSF
jgi:hypothetical protein